MDLALLPCFVRVVLFLMFRAVSFTSWDVTNTSQVCLGRIYAVCHSAVCCRPMSCASPQLQSQQIAVAVVPLVQAGLCWLQAEAQEGSRYSVVTELMLRLLVRTLPPAVLFECLCSFASLQCLVQLSTAASEEQTPRCTTTAAGQPWSTRLAART